MPIDDEVEGRDRVCESEPKERRMRRGRLKGGGGMGDGWGAGGTRKEVECVWFEGEERVFLFSLCGWPFFIGLAE